MKEQTPLRIGLALGSGSARGWAHIGVLQALRDHGIRPSVITGSSVGALVAAACASDQLETLEHWVRGLSKLDVWRLLDTTFSGGGVMRGNKLMRAVGENINDFNIEDMPISFGAVAADLYTGEEVWLQKGSMLNAVRASSGLPGLFAPMKRDGQWLIDGGVVNPVPVSLCRALGANFVIAVNLNQPYAHRITGQSIGDPPAEHDDQADDAESTELFSKWAGLLSDFTSSIMSGKEEPEPGFLDVMSATINIMQDRITRSRMVGDPPNVLITPRLSEYQLMDFHRAGEAIDIGKRAVRRVAPDLEALSLSAAN